MQYQFEEPFVVDSSTITTHLGVRATPLEQALEQTLATYRGRRTLSPTHRAGPRRPPPRRTPP